MGDLIESGPADAPQLADVAARAFLEDPVYRWLFPAEEAAKRMSRLRRFFEADLVKLHLPKKLTFHTPERDGVACWDPPGDWRVSVGRQLALLPTILQVFGARTVAALRGLSRIQAKHPEAPHYYLFLIAVAPEHQRCGLGSSLLEPMKARADAEGVGLYLESTNPKNEPWYVRHGFAADPPLPLAQRGPPVTPMWRSPR
jgi:ribosomal protein S18 acetylase RimI-like enzyme